MQTKKVGKTSMLSASEVLNRTRGQVAFLVEREERNTGSRTTAYENVAAMIGRSPSWVRSIFKGYSDAVPDLVTGMNIVLLYDKVCSRVEIEAENERALAALLREQLHAVTPGLAEMVESQARKEAAGAEASKKEQGR